VAGEADEVQAERRGQPGEAEDDVATPGVEAALGQAGPDQGRRQGRRHVGEHAEVPEPRRREYDDGRGEREELLPPQEVAAGEAEARAGEQLVEVVALEDEDDGTQAKDQAPISLISEINEEHS